MRTVQQAHRAMSGVSSPAAGPVDSQLDNALQDKSVDLFLLPRAVTITLWHWQLYLGRWLHTVLHTQSCKHDKGQPDQLLTLA